jgi:hypothetical protein
MKIAVGIMDFLNLPPRNTDIASGPVQRKHSREDHSRAPPRSADRDRGHGRESLQFERREDQRSRSAYSSYPWRPRKGRWRRQPPFLLNVIPAGNLRSTRILPDDLQIVKSSQSPFV